MPANQTTAGERRYAQAQRDNPEHPLLQKDWVELSSNAQAGWERLAEYEQKGNNADA